MKDLVKEIIGAKNITKIKTNIKFKKDRKLELALKRNEIFKNKYRGERCFIIGNGPSIQKVDFFSLRDEYTFTVNQLPRNNRFTELHSSFHVWADERFFDLDENNKEDMELLDVMKNVKTEDNNPIVFYKYSANAMINKYRLDKLLDVYYYEEGADKKILNDYFVDYAKLVPGFSTVVHYIICLAVYMGFKEIILLGCDCSGFITIAETKLDNLDNSKYGYKISENEKKRMKRVQEKTSMRDELSWYVSLFDDYQLLDSYCKRNGVKLINATYPSLLESIQKADLKDILNIK